MPIPTKVLLYRSILKIARSASESLSDKQIAKLLSDRFNLTDAERRAMIPSGGAVKDRKSNKLGGVRIERRRVDALSILRSRAITQPGREFLGRHDGEITGR